jgi:H+/Cl- antiporter ClcA
VVKLKWTFYSVIIGLLAGLSTTLFLYALDFVTLIHKTYSGLVWLLPVAGLISGILFLKFGERVEKGTGLILEEIHDPKNTLPFVMAPLIFIGTLITHIVGGSAGREGTAVQMGSTLADQLSKIFKIEVEERKILLIAGAGAAFSATIGAPIAGALFGLEVIQIGRLRFFALFECLVASYVAFYTTKLLHVHHTHFPKIMDISFNAHNLTTVIISGLIFGIAANLFIQFTHLVERLFKNYIQTKWLFPFVGGIILMMMFSYDGSYQFRGLGLIHIQNAFIQETSWTQPFFKAIFTGVTVGSGFKGGEFIPLVFIGSTLGSFLATVFTVSRYMLTAVGFAAVFGAAANTPIACSIMAAELFGWRIAPYAFVGCWIAYYLSGHIGIYKNQKLVHSKKDQLLKVFSWPQDFLKKFIK